MNSKVLPVTQSQLHHSNKEDAGSTIKFLPRVALDERRSYYAKASKEKLCLAFISSLYPHRNVAET